MTISQIPKTYTADDCHSRRRAWKIIEPHLVPFGVTEDEKYATKQQWALFQMEIIRGWK